MEVCVQAVIWDNKHVQIKIVNGRTIGIANLFANYELNNFEKQGRLCEATPAQLAKCNELTK